MTAKSSSVVLATLFIALFTGADWMRFRGPNGSGVAENAKLPLSWSTKTGENIGWTAELPGRGSSCPIVVGDRVFVTCCSGYRHDRLHVVCLNTNHGQRLWQRQLWATGRTMTQRSISPAAPTPVSDGKHVYAYFSSNDVACFDLDGNMKWVRGLMLEFPNASNSLGLASSPIVVDQTLIIKIETDSQSLALGLDCASGETRWTVERPALASWTSPIALHGAEAPTVVLLQSGRGLTAYDPKSGREVWKYDEGCATIPSSVAAGPVALIPSNGLVALRHTAGGKPDVLWRNHRLGPSTPTPLAYRNRIFILSGSILTSADLHTGDLVWRLRLKGGRFSGSPVAADQYVYMFSEDGVGHTIKLDDDAGRVVGGGDLGETILATPAIANHAMYIRSDGHLWKIASPAPSL